MAEIERIPRDEGGVVNESTANGNFSSELMQALRKSHPEWFSDTEEWKLRVHLEAAQKMYDETGLIIML